MTFAGPTRSSGFAPTLLVAALCALAACSDPVAPVPQAAADAGCWFSQSVVMRDGGHAVVWMRYEAPECTPELTAANEALGWTRAE